MPIEVIKVVKWHVDRGYRDPVVFGMRSARRMYAKLTAYIAKSVNEMDIQPDEENWPELTEPLHSRRLQLAAMTLQHQYRDIRPPSHADRVAVEKNLRIMNAASVLCTLVVASAVHGSTIGEWNVEMGWEALCIKARRMPSAVFLLGELEPEGGANNDADGDLYECSSSDEEEEDEDVEEVVVGDDDEFDDDDDIDNDDDDDFDDDGDDFDDDEAQYDSGDELNLVFAPDVYSTAPDPGGWKVGSSDDGSGDDDVEELEEVAEVEQGGRREMDTKDNVVSEAQPGPSDGGQNANHLALETVARLKGNLSARGLSSDGSVDDLVRRLLDAVPAAQVGLPGPRPDEPTPAIDDGCDDDEQGQDRQDRPQGKGKARGASSVLREQPGGQNVYANVSLKREADVDGGTRQDSQSKAKRAKTTT